MLTKNTIGLCLGFGFIIFMVVLGTYKNFEPNSVNFGDFTQFQQNFYEKYLAYCILDGLRDRESIYENLEGLCGCSAFCMATSDTENVADGFLEVSLRGGTWTSKWANLNTYCRGVCLSEWLESTSKCAAKEGVDVKARDADEIVVQKCGDITIKKFIRKYLPKKYQPNNL